MVLILSIPEARFTLAAGSTTYVTNANNTVAVTPVNFPVCGETYTVYPLNVIDNCSDHLVITTMSAIPASFSISPNPVCIGSNNCSSLTLGQTFPNVFFTYTNSWGPQIKNGQLNTIFNGPSTVICSSNYTVPGSYTGTLHLSYNAVPSSTNAVCKTTFTFNTLVTSSVTSVTAIASPSAFCSGQSTTLTASAGGAPNFTWQPGNLTGSLIVVSPGLSGTYTVISGGGGCGSATGFVTLNVGECCLKTLPKKPVIDLGAVTIVAPGASTLVWSNLVPGPTYNGNIALPAANYIISGDYNVVSALTIATSCTFISTRIAFGDGATVFQNATSYVDRSYWHGCDKNWQGIKSTKLLNLTNSVIEDAAFAVNVQAPFAGPLYPGLNLDNVFFNNNFTGVILGGNKIQSFKITGCIFTSRQIAPNSYPYISGLRWNSLPSFNSNALPNYPTALLKGSNTLLFPPTWRGQIGILLASAQNLSVPGNQSGTLKIGDVSQNNNSELTNVFDNLRRGVSAFSSKCVIYNNLFQNISYAPSVDPFTGTAGSYNDNNNASIGNNVNGNLAGAYSNTFITSHTGVYATKNSTLSVSNNTFKRISFAANHIEGWFAAPTNTSPVSINSNTFDHCFYDLYAFNNSIIDLVFNNNSSVYSAVGSKQPLAIHAYLLELNKPKAAKYTVNFNTSSGKLYGVRCENVYAPAITDNTLTVKPAVLGTDNGAIWLVNTDDGSIVKNTLNVNPTSSQNLQTNGIFTSIGVNNLYCENDIKGAGAAMKFMGPSPSKIYRNSLNENPSDPCVYGIFLDQNGFVGNINYPLGAGNISVTANNRFGDFTNADTRVENLATGSQIYYSGVANASNPYYPAINQLQSPSFISFSPFSTNFSNVVQCGVQQQLQNLSRGIPPFINNQISFGGNNANTYRIGDKSIFELFRKNAVNTGSVNGAPAFMASKASGPIGSFHQMDSLVAEYAITSDISKVSQAGSLNTALSATTGIDQNQKTFNGILYTFLQSDTLVTPAQLASLVSLAQLCPFTDGTSVYQARALLKHYDTTEYVSSCELHQPPNNNRIMKALSVVEKVNSSPEALGTIVFPNPAAGEVIVATEMKEASITIFSILGQPVLESALGAETRLNVSDLKNGTYFYKIIQGGRLIKSERIIINK